MLPKDDLLQDGSPAPNQLSLASWLAAIGALTICAAGCGILLGVAVASAIPKFDNGAAKPKAAAKYDADLRLVEVPPVITNLADPDSPWVRVQASIIYDRKAVQSPQVIAAQVGEDILGFIRTLSLAQIGGASGLQHLREDLNERVLLRSGGLVRELILAGLVVQ